MQPLDKTLRHRLERTIRDARDIAEAAAQAATGAAWRKGNQPLIRI